MIVLVVASQVAVPGLSTRERKDRPPVYDRIKRRVDTGVWIVTNPEQQAEFSELMDHFIPQPVGFLWKDYGYKGHLSSGLGPGGGGCDIFVVGKIGRWSDRRIIQCRIRQWP